MARKNKIDIVKLQKAPVVVVVGHVDHGKTTLLDKIRKTSVQTQEHGGITQQIGAYQIDYKSSDKNEATYPITFIDTPGHEAFVEMRSRGAKVADIAILVVSADDSVKPQTIEAIKHVKSANIPIIVAVNKIDLPQANVKKVYQDLAKLEVQVEELGGKVPAVKISAKLGTGILDLLEMIKIVGQMLDLKINYQDDPLAVVIETHLDKGKGMTGSVVVKSGVFKLGDSLYENSINIGKVRALFDDDGKRINMVIAGKPAEVIGLNTYPKVGSVISTKPRVNEDIVLEQEPIIKKETNLLPDFLKPKNEQEKSKLNLVLKADTAGSLEAVIQALPPRIEVVFSGVGEVSEADVLLAKSTKSFIVGFNVKLKKELQKLIDHEKVVIMTYNLIYKLIEDINEVAQSIEEVISQEKELGRGIVIAEFPFNGNRVAGTKIISNRLSKGDKVKILRNEEEIFRGRIKSMRHGKDEISKTTEKNECGILFDKSVDFQLNDVIIAIS